jgi:pilus assembly protein CpaC
MSKQRWAENPATVGLVVALTLLLGTSQRLSAQQPAQQPITFSIDGPTQRLEMVVSTSRILTLDHKIPRLLVNNTEIVRATPISPNQVQVSALQPGVTQLNIWDENNNLYTVDVVVVPDARQLEMLIKAEFPTAAVRVRPLAQSVYLSGYVPSPMMVRSIVQMAEDYYPSVINNLTIGGVQQIALRTKVMEVSRTKMRSLGFDWTMINGNDFVTQNLRGLVGGGGAFGADTDTVSFGIIDGNQAFYGFIEALRRNNLIKLMAEPTLTTVSGRAASFNSGGEFPILVPQSLGTVSVEYREYGTRVDFVPIVLGNGDLRLEVRPSVTEIDESRSVVLNNMRVPALRTRWVDTAVEMKAGQTLALAGLIKTRIESENRGIPWLADLPWFGAPFRRVQETANEVELLILVTPEFIDAVDPQQLPPCGPGESTESPCDVEFYYRSYQEVPKCCSDGTCQSCQGQPMNESMMGAQPMVPEAASSRRADAYDSSARRVNSQPAARSAGANQPANAGSLIGPVGYDELR